MRRAWISTRPAYWHTLQNRGQAALVVTYLCLCVFKIHCCWLPRSQPQFPPLSLTHPTPLLKTYDPVDLYTCCYLCLEHLRTFQTVLPSLKSRANVIKLSTLTNFAFYMWFWGDSTWDKGYPKFPIHLPPPPKHWDQRHESPCPVPTSYLLTEWMNTVPSDCFNRKARGTPLHSWATAICPSSVTTRDCYCKTCPYSVLRSLLRHFLFSPPSLQTLIRCHLKRLLKSIAALL